MRQLTATSYAILGLLAVKPRSAYDLVTQIKRSNIRLLWPRAESKLYEEPKNLVDHGLARAGSERTSGRSRAVYRITPRGRRALENWLDEPGAGLVLEFENMVKVVYGDFGTKQQLLENIRRIRDGTATGAALTLPLVRELAEVGPSSPERAHVIAIADRFLVELSRMTLRWAEWAEHVVEGWSGTTLRGGMVSEARALLAENARTVKSIAALAPAASRKEKPIRARRAR